MTRARSDSGAKAVCAREKESGDALRSSRKPLRTGAILLVIATVLAVFVNFMPLISFEAILHPSRCRSSGRFPSTGRSCSSESERPRSLQRKRRR